MKNAIQKAILGGYKGYPGVEFVVADGETFKFGGEVNEHRVLLDPEFWRCLGKQQGWIGKQQGWRVTKPLDIWEYHMHRFVDHLANGGTADEFFKDLLPQS